MGDFSAENSVVHEEQLNIFLIADEHLLETIGQEVSGFMILLVTNLWLDKLSSESSSGRAINTMNSSVRLRLSKIKKVTNWLEILTLSLLNLSDWNLCGCLVIFLTIFLLCNG